MKLNKIILAFAFFLALAFSIELSSAVASFQVTSFSCSPSEVVISSIFSCTATIQNTGDASGTVNTATLYPDSNNWLEDASYPQSYGQSISPGASASITFSGLRSTKSGSNGFTKIMLDSATDTYVADNNEEVNVINVVVSVSNSASSAAMGASVVSTSEITAGGNIDVSLSFTSNSGGCSIGSQTNPKTISGMTDGSAQTRTFTITQGTSGDCSYTISASATGAGGIASKTDSTTKTITCTNCPTSGGSSSSSGSSGGGSGSGGITKIYSVGELTSSKVVEVLDGEKVSFDISGTSHTFTLKSHTNTSASFDVESKKQSFNLKIGEEVKVDFNEDSNFDLLVKLKDINPTTNKVSIIFERLAGAEFLVPDEDEEVKENKKEKPLLNNIPEETKKRISWFVIIFIIIAIISFIIYWIERKKRKYKWGDKE